MKSLFVAFAFSLFGTLAFTGCGSAGGPEGVAQTGEDLSSAEPAPKTSAGSSSAVACLPNQKLCRVESATGACVERCVEDFVLCVTPPSCGVICDPLGAPPHAGCQWSVKTCQWDCPVCDPPPPPHAQGCSWDEKACVWICL